MNGPEGYTPPAVPAEEGERLKALHELGLLDTDPEPAFDRLTDLASTIFEVPIALVSLIDSNRQWFKSCFGLSTKETSREVSFCGHAILQQRPLVIPNALEDGRFAGNPLVTDGPKIRFYAGAPLDMGGGNKIGTLCLIDTRPRDFSSRHIKILELLSKQAVDAIALRRLNAESLMAQESFEELLQASPIAMIVHDGEKIVFANRASIRTLELGSFSGLSGKSVLDLASNEKVKRAFLSVIKKIESGQNVPVGDVVLNANGTGPVLEVHSRSVRYFGKAMILTSFRDVTEIRESQRVLRNRADTDDLTGLVRRQAFDQALASLLIGVGGASFSLAFLDVDHFKSVNDNFGHVAGDRVLAKIASTVKAQCRNADVAARWGGEEIAVLLPDCSLESAFKFAERVRIAVAELDDLPCKVTLSAGVAQHNLGESARDLVERADEAVYLAKSNGRNQVQRA